MQTFTTCGKDWDLNNGGKTNVDATETITHIGLCAGYGGIELGLKRVLPTLRTIALSEIEAFACANLVAKMEAGLMDPAPIWTDLKSFPYEQFRGRVDILTGGYPCQPFSSAGKRAGKDDPRHLWPWIADGIRILQPRVCFFENVEGHISLGLSSVISDLEELGYQATWGIFSASECLDANGRTAPHQRKRVFIMAVAGSIGSEARLSGSLTRYEGQSRVADNCGAQDVWPSRPGEPQHAWEPPRVVGNTSGNGRQHDQQSEDRQQAGAVAKSGAGLGNAEIVRVQGKWPEQQTARFVQSSCFNAVCHKCNRQTQPSMGGDFDGVTSGLDYAELCVTCDNRTDELRLLGNGVVPATAALAFRTLLDELQRG